MSVDAWKRKRTPIKTKLARFKNQFAAYNKESGVGTWPLQLEKIEPLYDRFDEIQTKIEMAAEGDETIQESCERSDFETLYFEIVSEVREFIENNRPTSSSSSTVSKDGSSDKEPTAQASYLTDLAKLLSASSLASNLRTIQIPKFDGSYNDWVKFRDSYKTLVHDKSELTGIQKFHFLNDALGGEAARVIQSLSVTEENYELAWKSLIHRFDDSRSLVHFHMKCLFDLAVLSKTTFSALRQLIDDANNHLLALKSLGENIDAWDTVIIHLLTTKLDSFTKREWEKRFVSLPAQPTFKEMIKFLETHCKYLQRVTEDKPKINQSNSQRKSGPKGFKVNSFERVTSHATTKKLCPICQESHELYQCKKFLALPVSLRIDEIRKLRFCFNCMSPGHQNRQCKARSCRKCHRKHNTLLHLDYDKIQEEQDTEEVMLGTAVVWVEDSDGNRHECRVLLDSCSQIHLMTQRLCQRLKLPIENSNKVVSGVFKSTQEPEHCTSVKFISRSSSFSKRINCLIATEITDDMPNRPVRRSDFEIPDGLILADPDFDKTRPVDLLIGAGSFWRLLCVGQIHLRSDQPLLQKTQLGWIVTGAMQVPSNDT